MAETTTVDLDAMMSDGLSPHDLEFMTDIIRYNHGNWYHAHLMRALHELLPRADEHNLERLRRAYPGSVAAYAFWYNHPNELRDAAAAHGGAA